MSEKNKPKKNIDCDEIKVSVNGSPVPNQKHDHSTVSISAGKRDGIFSTTVFELEFREGDPNAITQKRATEAVIYSTLDSQLEKLDRNAKEKGFSSIAEASKWYKSQVIEGYEDKNYTLPYRAKLLEAGEVMCKSLELYETLETIRTNVEKICDEITDPEHRELALNSLRLTINTFSTVTFLTLAKVEPKLIAGGELMKQKNGASIKAQKEAVAIYHREIRDYPTLKKTKIQGKLGIKYGVDRKTIARWIEKYK